MLIGIGAGIKPANLRGTLAVLDSFDRADSLTSLGSADTGQVWTAHAGTWGISGSTAYIASSVSDAAATVDTGTPDGLISLDLTTGTSIVNGIYCGIDFRTTDATNRLFARLRETGHVELYKQVAGTYTSLGSAVVAVAVNTTYRLAVRLVGSSIKVLVDGVELLSVTETFNNTVTHHGLTGHSAGDSLAVRWDNFRVDR